jgi:hypothetical protein
MGGGWRSGGICSCCVPRFAQVIPGRIHLLNKRYLLGAGPAFDLLFSRQRRVDVLEMLKPYQPMTFVLSGKTRDRRRLMLSGSASDTISHATIQNSRTAANYVHVVMVVSCVVLLPYVNLRPLQPI